MKPALRTGLMLGIYALMNAVFVYKYSERARGIGWLAASCYLLIVVPLLAVARGAIARGGWVRRMSGVAYGAGVLVLAAGLTALMFRFDPARIRVARYWALHDWLDRLLQGTFPYGSQVQPSGFPFLYIVALPFHLAGELGLLQIAAFLAFAWLCAEARHDRGPAASAMMLLVAAPVFVYEVVVRSELITNMVLVLAFLVWIERALVAGRRASALQGIVGGLLLSTRGIVALVYAVALAAWLRADRRSVATLGAWASVTFLATLAPFVLWDPAGFASRGPLAIQSSYIPAWLLAASLGAAAVLGYRARSARDVYFLAPIVLFAVVAAVLLESVVRDGWTRTIVRDGFDISYLSFGLPFLLYALVRSDDQEGETR